MQPESSSAQGDQFSQQRLGVGDKGEKARVRYRWTIEENFKYIEILKEVKASLEEGEFTRRSQKPFRLMEEKLGIGKTS